jgi:glycosyltransferase involved in cell wall biosynthesis
VALEHLREADRPVTDRPRRVWYVFPYAGGPGLGRFTRPYDLGREWLGHGVATTVFAAQHHHVLYDPNVELPAELLRDEIRYRFVEAKPYSGNGLARVRHMLGFARRLPNAMREQAGRHGPPDAIIVSSPHPFPIYPAASFARRNGARLVFEVRDMWPLALKETLGTPVWHPFYVLLAIVERFAYRRADRVVSLWSGARDHMTARGLAPEKFTVIRNSAPNMASSAIDVDPKVSDWIAQCRSEGRRIVGYAGAFGPPNAMLTFLDIGERLASDVDLTGRLAFLFVGDGVEREPLERGLQILAAKLTPFRFHFAGSVTRGTAAELLRCCDAGMILDKNTSLSKYGIAKLKLSEYMRLGRPILAAYDAVDDPVTEAGCGWRIAPESADRFVDTLRDFVNLPAADLEAMGERGRAHFAANYEYSAIARKYLEVLQLSPQRRAQLEALAEG